MSDINAASLLHSPWDVLVLPREISSFERDYLARVNRISLRFLLLHIPAFTLLAWFNDTGPLTALLLTSAVLVGPVIAYRSFENPRSVGLVYGFTAMLMGGLLVHFGQGPVQIEMHFYFFALLAMLVFLGNPLAIAIAAATVAAHHILLWTFLPASVFNYAAPWWVVGVHAGFVVLEASANIYIARSFFDNVIGLERVIEERTNELGRRTFAMRLVLDNVEQGLLTIDAEAKILPEYSASLARWFGHPESGQALHAFLGAIDPHFADFFGLGWEQCVSGALPLEVAVAQLPVNLAHGGRHFRVSYQPLLGDRGSVAGALVSIADVSAERQRERLEVEQRETSNILDRVIADRTGFIEFFEEGEALVASLAGGREGEPESGVRVRRALHTLKGICMVFGIQTVADRCHELEAALQEENRVPTPEELADIEARWSRLRQRASALLGERGTQRIEIDTQQFDALLRAALERRDHGEIARLVVGMRLESSSARLLRVAAQARGIAQRLNKQGVEVQIDSAPVQQLEPRRWASFWSSFVHVVRNAVDHGLESSERRVALGKPGHGQLRLQTHVDGSEFVISLTDDGAGIDWNKVRQRARSLGLRHETHEDLVEALFVDGLSTAEHVTEFSGRGVGLGIVREACLERGGRIVVESQLGAGTTFSFRFPRTELSVRPEELLHEPSPRSDSQVA